jgi:hypothetical protein
MRPSCVSHASRGCVRTDAIQTHVNCQAPRAQALICTHADACLASLRMRTHSHAHAHAPHHPRPHTHTRVCVRHLPRGHEHWERRRGTDLYKVHRHQHVCHRGFKHRRIEVKPPCAEQRFFSRVGRGLSCLPTRHCGAYPSPHTHCHTQYLAPINIILFVTVCCNFSLVRTSPRLTFTTTTCHRKHTHV